MKYSAVLIFLFFLKGIKSSGAEKIKDDSLVLNVFLKSKVSGLNKNVDDKIESIRISSGDTITFVCKSKSVHMWDGQIDHGKFLAGMKPVQRNSTGYFSSSLVLRLHTLPIQDFSIGFEQNYVKCFELDQEKMKRATCINLNPEQDRKSHLVANANEKAEKFSVSLYTCPHVRLEDEIENDDHPMKKEIPEWMWNAKDNSVLCQVERPSRIQLKSISCNYPSACNIRRTCTEKTCPTFAVLASPNENLSTRQSMQGNFVSGQLGCEANGFSTHLNYVRGFNNEMCYFKPHRGVSFCPVLDLEISDEFHGLPLQLRGRALKFVIIQEPEVEVILTNGQVIKSTVHIESKLKHHKKYPYFTFTINTTAHSNIKLIKVIGHRYDSNQPVVIRKQINVKVGAPPKITGLPNELKLLKSDATTVLPFRITGRPDPKFVLSFNGMVVSKTDRRFSIFMDRKGYKYLKIHTINGNFYGPLTISASNSFGNREFTIVIKDSLRLTKSEAYRFAAALVVLIIFIHYIAFKCIRRLYRRLRRFIRRLTRA